LPSKAILFSDDAAFCAPIVGVIEPYGWSTTVTADADAALSGLRPDVALVLLDGGVNDAPAYLRRVRAEPQPTGGVPVLQQGGARLDGTSALLPAAADAATLRAAIEAFTGTLSDHALRRAPFSPFYRLVRLLGTRHAADMTARFADTLRMTLADAAPSPDQAHRLAGLAGAIGYSDLGRMWRAAEPGVAALAATRAVLAEIERDDLARYRS
jgi:hypothetical protein